jgi:hypothetical protein
MCAGPVVRGMAPGIVIGSLLAGAGAFAVLKGQGAGLFFASSSAYMALQMLRGKPSRGQSGTAGTLGQAAWAASSASCRRWSAPVAPSCRCPS